ncbi:GlxA family transcriptional regulator [Fodinibius sediminis]|uniref:Transcriptional regulator, AraC family with amidase-like domain n=1 Tax=Fodinibius sediminis TaxID=1214077 RepID=A0A521E684_9BACT|nr:helix-turn-helix domain-containing protein [Fodinibius sediminis]SMO79372.1 transcriptional regulator, AraC family with amidase-like domain [Fodinibius sediminis]
MKHLTIIVPAGRNNLESIVGPYNIFSRANKHWKESSGKPLFDIELAGLSNEVGFYGDLFAVKPQTRIAAVSKTDLIIIPSLNHNYREAVKGNKELVDWIKRQYKEGAEVASICTGAFLLASSGLLDGKSCSTHWSAADNFRKIFPNVKVEPDKLITDEDGIYTNGGAYSFLNLMIYLVEKYYDRQTAIYCSKVFQIEMDRECQSAFIIFKGQKMHKDEIVREAQDYIEKNVHEKITVKQLASRFAVSRRQFDRRFISATGNTPFEYVQRVKVETAKKLLEVGRKTVSEVMYEVGYSDASAFRRVFKEITSLTPVEYKNRYNREAVVL